MSASVSASPDDDRDWLEAVGEGLGAHVSYGAANVALLGALDEEDIKEIGQMLRYDGGPPPL